MEEMKESVVKRANGSERTAGKSITLSADAVTPLSPPVPVNADCQDLSACTSPAKRPCVLLCETLSHPLPSVWCQQWQDPEKGEDFDYKRSELGSMSTAVGSPLPVGRQTEDGVLKSPFVKDSAEFNNWKKGLPTADHLLSQEYSFSSSSESENTSEIFENSEPFWLLSTPVSGQSSDNLDMISKRLTELHRKRQILRQRKARMQQELSGEKKKLYTNLISCLTCIKEELMESIAEVE
ncbi:uncharacterized protein LOC144819913 [Lissotriton helveticus]